LKKKLIRITTVPGSFGLLKGQLKFLSEHGYNIIAISSSKTATVRSLEEVSQTEGVRVYPVEMSRKISPVKDLKSVWKLYIFFKKEKPNIIHSITPKAGLLSMIAARFAGIPIRIHTFTGLIFPSKTGLYQKLLIWMDRLLCFCATNIYPEGKGVKNDLIKYKITNKPLKIIGNGNINGIDTSFFDPQLISEEQKTNLRNSLGIKPDDFIFLFVGRIVKDKGINESVSAFKVLYERYTNIKLLLVGRIEKELDPLLKETEIEIKKNPNIILAGYQNDIRPYLAIANTFVFPSYREGFPNVILQAAAMNLCCIVTNINGCNEIIKDGKNGFIIPVKSIESLINAMEYVCRNPELTKKLGHGSRDEIIEKYERKYIWGKILEEYNSIL
jgi:glycosyltransferase involved in cell wall biosynthesis